MIPRNNQNIKGGRHAGRCQHVHRYIKHGRYVWTAKRVTRQGHVQRLSQSIKERHRHHLMSENYMARTVGVHDHCGGKAGVIEYRAVTSKRAVDLILATGIDGF